MSYLENSSYPAMVRGGKSHFKGQLGALYVACGRLAINKTRMLAMATLVAHGA